jgi:hypothetical protein
MGIDESTIDQLLELTAGEVLINGGGAIGLAEPRD